jgi:hypothetical protein
MAKILRFLAKYFYALFSSIYMFSAGIFVRKNRDLISAVAAHFGFGNARKKGLAILLPEIRAEDLVPEPPDVRLKEADWTDGNVSLPELILINQLVRTRRPEKVFEMGTFDGRTALNIALNLEEGGLLFTLDLPREEIANVFLPIHAGDSKHILKNESGARFKGRPEGRKITQLYGDTAKFDFSPFENRIDFVFIDAAHSFEYVLNDSKIALRLLARGKGTILWHDYGTFDGVTEALNKLFSEGGFFKGIGWIKGTSLAYLCLR